MTNRAPRKTNQELLHDIYSATHELLKTEGYPAITFSRVAKMAHTGRPVLYRRWNSPFSMVVAAEEYMNNESDDYYESVDYSGHTLRENLIATISHFNGSPEYIKAFLIELGKGSADVMTFMADMQKQNIRIMDRIFAQAQVTGEIQRSTTEYVKLLPFNLLMHQVMMTQDGLDDRFVAEMIDTVVLPAIMAQQPA
ncbi:TetR/AcrR family transcriptional regulator [Secundilactobacillus kimchicus]|uniref:HTH tetR-type domain-containing protein n=2 Tax=Secundilactobacillus kimchicus TaxID=528209 RepID=A0A0R1HQX4_9LACO|nr:TetR/AcrR family transcriptional regulator [Secundilactobacillus kimchicus]KRK48838.1 hypothetical protein FC96_GL001159 [Secundilactobacillus kimchicus JCM 15530]